jgi:hypothetical protein
VVTAGERAALAAAADDLDAAAAAARRGDVPALYASLGHAHARLVVLLDTPDPADLEELLDGGP